MKTRESSTEDSRPRRSQRLRLTVQDQDMSAEMSKDEKIDASSDPPQRGQQSQRRSSRQMSQSMRTKETLTSKTQRPASIETGHTVHSTGTSISATSTRNKRKRTQPTKPSLSVSTQRAPRRNASKKSKTITPSPAATAATAAFGFETPRRPRRSLPTSALRSSQPQQRQQIQLPPGVADLYRRYNNRPSFASPVSFFTTSKTASTVQDHSISSTYCNECSGISDSCSAESLTAEYLRIYGQDHWRALHAMERPLLVGCEQYLRSSKGNYDHRKHSQSSSSSPTFTSDEYATDENDDQEEITVDDDNVELDSPSSSFNTILRTPPKRKNYVAKEFWFKSKGRRSFVPPHKLFPQKEPIENSESLTALHQNELTPNMRTILVDWLIELSEHFSFGPATLHLAITLTDRVLACGPFGDIEEDMHGHDEDMDDNDDASERISLSTKCYRIRRSHYQLLGGTCTWIACKLLEVGPPKIKEITYVSDGFYNDSQVKSMEKRVCNALKFAFFQEPTPYQFLLELLRASYEGDHPECPCGHSYCGIKHVTESTMSFMANYLVELGRLPFDPTTSKPSLLAASAVYLTRVTLGLRSKHPDPTCDPFGFWTPSLEYYSSYSKIDLKETVLMIHSYHLAAEALTTLKAPFTKYQSRKYDRIALRTVVKQDQLGF